LAPGTRSASVQTLRSVTLEWGTEAVSARIAPAQGEDEAVDDLINDLSDRRHATTCRDGGYRSLDTAHSEMIELLFASHMLRELSQGSIIEALRSENIGLPVRVAKILDEVEERARAFNAANDGHPARRPAMVGLVKQIERLLLRPADNRETILRVGPLELDLINRTARRGDREIELLPRQFKLLEYLMRHSSRVVTRDKLLAEVWNYRVPPKTNLIDVHVSNLRRKIDGRGEPPLLYNVRCIGIILRPPD